MMRRREMELEKQISELKGKLEEKKQEADRLSLELGARDAKLQEKNALIDQLRAREGDVVSAMAQIETLRVQRMQQAEEQARSMQEAAQNILDEARAEAEAERKSAKEEAERIRAAAEAEAKASLEGARAQAENMINQAEAFRQDHVKATRDMNGRLAALAERFGEELESLRKLSGELREKNREPEADGAEIEDMRKALHSEAVETPESYESPAGLMQSIYAIEQRALPEEEGEQDAPFCGAQAEAAQAPQADAAAENAAEERVWTVDDVVDSMLEEEAQGTGTDTDRYLEKLIDEILQ